LPSANGRRSPAPVRDFHPIASHPCRAYKECPPKKAGIFNKRNKTDRVCEKNLQEKIAETPERIWPDGVSQRWPGTASGNGLARLRRRLQHRNRRDSRKIDQALTAGHRASFQPPFQIPASRWNRGPYPEISL